MPDSLEAAIVFALLIVPGYAFLSGYRLGREKAGPVRDLYAVAEAVVVSVILLAIAWFRVSDLLTWIDDDTLDAHKGGALVLLLALILLPFAGGRVVAELFEWLADRPGPERLLRKLKLIPEGNAWQKAWAATRNGALVVIDLKDGGTLYGQVADGVRIDLPPGAPALYLPIAYRPLGAGDGAELVRMTHGVYVHGEQIAALYLTDGPSEQAAD
jgi:hypothetical protein